MTKSLDGLTDEELFRTFAEGDRAAFEALLRRLERPLYNYVLRALGEPERAPSLFQDVLKDCVERADDLTAAPNLRVEVFSIARSRCAEARRRSPILRHSSPGRTTSPGLLVVEEPLGPPPDPQTRLAQAVDDLPDEQRDVFLLRELAQMSFAEIAEVVQIAETAAKSRMRYALERIQRALSDVDPREPF